MQTISPLTKRYYITSDEVNYYPEAFVTSKRVKYVHVIGVHIFKNISGNHYIPHNIELHADFVQADDYQDHFVCYANEENIHRKYQQFRPKNTFRVWFTDHHGGTFTMTDYSFTVELLLEY